MSLKTVSLNKDSWVVMSNLIMIEGKLQKNHFEQKENYLKKTNFWIFELGVQEISYFLIKLS